MKADSLRTAQEVPKELNINTPGHSAFEAYWKGDKT